MKKKIVMTILMMTMLACSVAGCGSNMNETHQGNNQSVNESADAGSVMESATLPEYNGTAVDEKDFDFKSYVKLVIDNYDQLADEGTSMFGGEAFLYEWQYRMPSQMTYSHNTLRWSGVELVDIDGEAWYKILNEQGEISHYVSADFTKLMYVNENKLMNYVASGEEIKLYTTTPSVVSSWFNDVARAGGVVYATGYEDGSGCTGSAPFYITAGAYDGEVFVEEDCLSDKGAAWSGDTCYYDCTWERSELTEDGKYVYTIKDVLTGTWSARYTGNSGSFNAAYFHKSLVIGDGFTGTIFEEKSFVSEGSYEGSVDIPVEDETYHIDYTVEMTSEFTRDFSESDGVYSAPFKTTYTYTITVPENYGGLMLLFDEKGMTSMPDFESGDIDTHVYGDLEGENFEGVECYLLCEIIENK